MPISSLAAGAAAAPLRTKKDGDLNYVARRFC
jgi:hypothetical protein